MSVDTLLAHCPRCGSTKPSIFIRSDDAADLVCRSTKCREGLSLDDASTPQPSRRSLRRIK